MKKGFRRSHFFDTPFKPGLNAPILPKQNREPFSQKGFFLSMEIVVAVGILALAGGGLVFFTSQAPLLENSLQSQQTRAMIQTQTKFLMGQTPQGTLAPLDYYCYKTLSINPNGIGLTSILQDQLNCETDSSLNDISKNAS